MIKWNYQFAKVGDRIPELMIKPISRKTLALYAGASGDHNPIHIDLDFAKQSGLPDVIAHGMLIMSYLGRALTDNIDQINIKEYGVQFSSMTNIGDILACNGLVTDLDKKDDKKLLKIDLNVSDQNNDNKLIGYSIVDVS